jgi:signal transduction histidine kinase
LIKKGDADPDKIYRVDWLDDTHNYRYLKIKIRHFSLTGGKQDSKMIVLTDVSKKVLLEFHKQQEQMERVSNSVVSPEMRSPLSTLLSQVIVFSDLINLLVQLFSRMVPGFVMT